MAKFEINVRVGNNFDESKTLMKIEMDTLPRAGEQLWPAGMADKAHYYVVEQVCYIVSEVAQEANSLDGVVLLVSDPRHP